MKWNYKYLVKQKRIATQRGAVAVEFAFTMFIAMAIIFLFIDMLLIMLAMNVQQSALSSLLADLKIKGNNSNKVKALIAGTLQEFEFGYIVDDSISVKTNYFATLGDAAINRRTRHPIDLVDFPILRIDIKYKYKYKADLMFGLFNIQAPAVSDTIFVRLEKK